MVLVLRSMSREQKTIAVLLMGLVLLSWAYGYVRREILFWYGAKELPSPEASKPTIMVHVTGAVREPGVYKLQKGCRVQDAIGAAGGLAESADADVINLAALLTDGQRLSITEKASPQQAPDGGSAIADSLIDLNTASASQLETLPGVGPEMAKRILDWRKQNGRFQTVDDLRKISGIGERTFARLKPLVKVR
jgi:competence protein ComEA